MILQRNIYVHPTRRRSVTRAQKNLEHTLRQILLSKKYPRTFLCPTPRVDVPSRAQKKLEHALRQKIGYYSNLTRDFASANLLVFPLRESVICSNSLVCHPIVSCQYFLMFDIY